MVMPTNRKPNDSTAIVSVAGDLNFENHRDFQTVVAEHIEGGKAKVVVDMSKVTHVDSMGLGTITKLWRNAHQKEAELCLAAVPSNILKMIKLVNLDGRIKLYDTVEDALA
jgi:anti-sigma B factor antagonist